MRELAVAGLIAIAFGVGSWYATRDANQAFGLFHQVNLIGGLLALAVAGLFGARRLRAWAQPGLRGVLARGLCGVLVAFVIAFALVRGSDRAGLRFDWTVDRKFDLSEATRDALVELSDDVDALLFYDAEDPRVRSTRLLLGAMEQVNGMKVADRPLDAHPLDADRYGVGSSNTVVLRHRDRFETVGRPTEGTIYEALYRLRSIEAGLIYVARGSGEGDIEATGDAGFSGLAQALLTEGYRIRSFVAAQGIALPDDVAAVVWIAPQRGLPAAALSELGAYLARGGRLVAFLEPGVEAGLGDVLSEWGLHSPDGVLIDPASGRVDGDTPGLNPLAYNFTSHPIAHGLGPGRMAFFRGARSFQLRKPRVEDDLADVALASPRSWIASDLSVLRGADPVRPADARNDYHPLVVAGRYPREAGETRIVAFGDADFASNRQLRTLYNLDLVLNAVHWAMEREPEIKLRPKANVAAGAQFALPIQNTLARFYAVGLLIPELLFLTAAVLWVRTRSR